MTIEGVRRVVAVKVRHPGVADIIRRDFQVRTPLSSCSSSSSRSVLLLWFVACCVAHSASQSMQHHLPYLPGNASTLLTQIVMCTQQLSFCNAQLLLHVCQLSQLTWLCQPMSQAPCAVAQRCNPSTASHVNAWQSWQCCATTSPCEKIQ